MYTAKHSKKNLACEGTTYIPLVCFAATADRSGLAVGWYTLAPE